MGSYYLVSHWRIHMRVGLTQQYIILECKLPYFLWVCFCVCSQHNANDKNKDFSISVQVNADDVIILFHNEINQFSATDLV